MWTLPNTITGSSTAMNLTSTDTHQFAAWYTLAGEVRVGRIERGVQRWGVDHDEFEITGAARTELALPTGADEHNYISIGVQGTSVANYVVWLWANMHVNPIRMIKSAAGSITSWSVPPDLPSVETRCTYPTPVQLPDGRLWFYLRDGPTGSGSARSDAHFWILDNGTWSARTKIFQGLSVPGAGPGGTPGSGASVDDDTNWNAYHTIPYVEGLTEPNPGRMHIQFTWRLWNDGAGAPAVPDRTCEFPSYIWSDNYTSFFAVDGTPVTLPIHPLNNSACQTGLTADDPSDVGFVNGAGLCIDDAGRPHFLMSSSPNYHGYWDGAAWQAETFASPTAGITMYNAYNCVWWHGQLWFLGVSAPAGRRVPRMWSLDETQTMAMGGPCANAGGWEVVYDTSAWRLHRTIEVLTPDGDTPKVVAVGENAKFGGPGSGVGFTMVPSSIDSTGATDVVDELNTWMGTLPDGTKIMFPAGGTYKIQGNPATMPGGTAALTPPATDTIREIDFNGCTLDRPDMLDQVFRHPLSNPHIELVNLTNITLRNCVIRGLNNNDGSLNQYADAFEGGRTVTNGVTTAGSPVITSATANFTTGDQTQFVSGAGIPSGTRILTRNSATQATMNANALATATGVTIGIGWDPQFRNRDGTLKNVDNKHDKYTLGTYGVYNEALIFGEGVRAGGGDCDGIYIYDFDISGVFGDHIGLHQCQNVEVVGLLGRRNGRHGGSFTGGSNILFNTYDVVATYSIVDIEPIQSLSTSNVEISDGIGECDLFAFPNNGVGDCDDIRWLRNTVNGASSKWLVCDPIRTMDSVDATIGSSTLTRGTGGNNFAADMVGEEIFGPGIPVDAIISSFTSVSQISIAPFTAISTQNDVEMKITAGERTNYQIRDNESTYVQAGQNSSILLAGIDGCIIDGNTFPRPVAGTSVVFVALVNFPTTGLEITNNFLDNVDIVVDDVIGGSDWIESGNTF